MWAQKPSVHLVVILLAILGAFSLYGLSCLLFPDPQPPNETFSPLILPMPSDRPNTTLRRPIVQLDVALSQYPPSTNSFSFNITQGKPATINVTLTSLSNQTEFTIPLYLAVGAFENQPTPKMITSPPSPYPVLPWPSHDDSPDITKPFEASFSPNPLVLKPNESKSVTLAITALEDAKPGVYTMLIELGNGEQTGLGGATFYLTVNAL
jgi:hypothetical protein